MLKFPGMTTLSTAATIVEDANNNEKQSNEILIFLNIANPPLQMMDTCHHEPFW
jgi:hypothetical protein